MDKYSKKEAARMRKQKARLTKYLEGIKNMPGLPHAMFVIDTRREAIAVAEARRLNIPCIGIVDTNCDPDNVSIPVPGNDDAIRAVNLFCSVMADAVIEGRAQNEQYVQETAAAKADEEGAEKPEAGEEAAGAETQEAAAEETAETEEAPAASEEEAAEEASEEESEEEEEKEQA
jgi:small subunit ribosomal protein S2